MTALRSLAAKAWRESRTRFGVSSAILIAICAGVTLLHDHVRAQVQLNTGAAPDFASYVHGRVYVLARAVYLVLVLVLALGGLHRERAHGTLGFTLALPASIRAHILARAAVGVAQVAALAALPVIVVPLGSALVGESYRWVDAARFAVVWTAVGAAAFAAGIVVSVLVRSDYLALMVTVGALRFAPIACAHTPGLDRVPTLDGWLADRTRALLDPQTKTLAAVPWAPVIAAIVIALGLIAIAVVAAPRRIRP